MHNYLWVIYFIRLWYYAIIQRLYACQFMKHNFHTAIHYNRILLVQLNERHGGTADAQWFWWGSQWSDAFFNVGLGGCPELRVKALRKLCTGLIITMVRWLFPWFHHVHYVYLQSVSPCLVLSSLQDILRMAFHLINILMLRIVYAMLDVTWQRGSISIAELTRFQIHSEQCYDDTHHVLCV